jgi:hypothetical protein
MIGYVREWHYKASATSRRVSTPQSVPFPILTRPGQISKTRLLYNRTAAANPATPAKPAAAKRTAAPLVDAGVAEPAVVAAPPPPVVGLPDERGEGVVYVMWSVEAGRESKLLPRDALTVVTMVEPRLLVVVTLTPVGLAVTPVVPLPPTAPADTAVAVVTNVVPWESVVVMATPPDTSPPMVEVMLRPAVSAPVATRTLAVLRGASVRVIVSLASPVAESSALVVVAESSALVVVAESSVLLVVARAVARAVAVAEEIMLLAEIWASEPVEMISIP